MRADGEIDAGVALSDRDQAVGRVDPGADGDHPLDAGGFGALDDSVEFVGEVGEVEVAMAVDETEAHF